MFESERFHRWRGLTAQIVPLRSPVAGHTPGQFSERSFLRGIVQFRILDGTEEGLSREHGHLSKVGGHCAVCSIGVAGGTLELFNSAYVSIDMLEGPLKGVLRGSESLGTKMSEAKVNSSFSELYYPQMSTKYNSKVASIDNCQL